MEDDKYWRLRATEMRERPAQIKDPFISGGFLTLARQYEQLAESGVRSVWPTTGGASIAEPLAAAAPRSSAE